MAANADALSLGRRGAIEILRYHIHQLALVRGHVRPSRCCNGVWVGVVLP